MPEAVTPTWLPGGGWVCDWGSGIPGPLGRGEQIHCPVLFHFGGEDPCIARTQAVLVATFAASLPDMECHIQDDASAPVLHEPEAAARAWEVTKAFLARTLRA